MESKLREDFPVDWDEDQYVSRREFLKFMTLASGGLALGSSALVVWTIIPRAKRTFEPLEIARVDELPLGEAKHFAFPRAEDMCILIHVNPGVYVAYSRRCTHLSCPVEWQPGQQRIYCPCHNGAFSPTDGRVLQGPPPRALPRINVEVRGRSIFATGVELDSA